MLLSEQKFFEDVLNLEVPELKLASELYSKGDRNGAMHELASYVKKILDPEKFYKCRLASKNLPVETFMEAADRAVANKFRSVGVDIDFGTDGTIDWVTNPTYNAYREWVYQFNRHAEWQPLAMAYRHTGDEKYAECFKRLVRSWIETAEQCPENMGSGQTLCWRSIECGIRMQNPWSAPIHLCSGSKSIDDETWTLIFMSIWENVYRIRNFGAYSGNWLIIEMQGLLSVCVFYGSIYREAAEWLKFGLDTLEVELEKEFYPDGMQIELSTGYHSTVREGYEYAIELCRQYGVKLPEKLDREFKKIYKMYTSLVMPSLEVPALNDGGKKYVPRMLTKAIQFFPDDEEYKYFTSERKEGKRPDYNTKIMNYAGIIAMRTGFEEDDFYALFESAHFGDGHYHEDKLNFLLYAYRTDMLPDSGNFRYDKSNMRQYVIGTRSHNTGLVDGLHQNRLKKYVRACVDTHKKSNLRARLGDSIEVADGEYNEGYGPDLLPAVHKRKVVFFKEGVEGTKPLFLLIDSYTCEDGEKHLYETSFQLPVVDLTVRGVDVVANYETGATLTFVSSASPKIIIGQESPAYIGWRPNHTPEVKRHYPAPVLSYTEYDKQANIVTALYPNGSSESCPIKSVLADDSGFELIIGDKAVRYEYTDKLFETDEV